MQVSLVMFKSDGTRRDFPLDSDRVVIGRKNNCDLRIPLSSVSRQHCEVRVEDDEVKLRDLGSSNGTLHNDIRVQEATLEAGDTITAGPVVFTLVIDGEPADVEPVESGMGQAAPSEEAAQASSTSDAPQSQTLTAGDSTENVDEAMDTLEPETTSPTVDLDDPIAALEQMTADGTADEQDGDVTSSEESDPGELELDEDKNEDKNEDEDEEVGNEGSRAI